MVSCRLSDLLQSAVRAFMSTVAVFWKSCYEPKPHALFVQPTQKQEQYFMIRHMPSFSLDLIGGHQSLFNRTTAPHPKTRLRKPHIHANGRRHCCQTQVVDIDVNRNAHSQEHAVQQPTGHSFPFSFTIRRCLLPIPTSVCGEGVLWTAGLNIIIDSCFKSR